MTGPTFTRIRGEGPFPAIRAALADFLALPTIAASVFVGLTLLGRFI